MDFHDVANAYRMMNTEEFAALKDSIKKNGGVREPIVVQGGTIIDGRNRWKACEELGIECRTIEYDEATHGTDIASFVRDANSHRRHLTMAERLAAGKRLLEVFKAETKAKEHDRKAAGTTLVNLPKSNSAVRAANAVGLSEKTIRQAAALEKKSPELSKQVDAGKLSLNAAVKQSKAPPKPEPKKDGAGREITNQALKDAMAAAPKLSEIGRLIDEARRGIEALVGQPIAAHLVHQKIIIDLGNAKSAVLWGMPFTECPYMPNCKRGCKVCGGAQWVNKDKWKAVPQDIREAKSK